MKLANMVKVGLGALVVVSGFGLGGISGAFGHGAEGVATAAVFKPGDIVYEKDYGTIPKKSMPYHAVNFKVRGVVAKDGKHVDMVARLTNKEKGPADFRVGIVKDPKNLDLYPKWAPMKTGKVGEVSQARFARKSGTYYFQISLNGYTSKNFKNTHKGTL